MDSLKPFFCYYGGKWRAARHYPKPRYGTLVEAFAGGAGYALRYPSKQVILYEIDPVIFSLWDYLIKVSTQEIRSLPLEVEHVDDHDIPAGAKYLIGFWLNKASAQPRKQPSTWARSKVRPNSFWGEVIRERIVSQLSSIRHWKVFNCSYEECTEDYEATWFVDPPYHGLPGKLYRYKNIDYEKLGAWCQSRKGQTIVCEHEGASWLPFKTLGTFKATEGPRGKSKTLEMIWTNQ